jgi:hypothetical protein
MQGGIERACFEAKNLLGHLLDIGRNPKSVVSSPPENLQYEEFQRALEIVYFCHELTG